MAAEDARVAGLAAAAGTAPARYRALRRLFPPVVTVFSAPNYCDQVGNKGAFVKLDDQLQPQFVSFPHVPHPDVRPMAYAGRSPLQGMF